MQISNKIFSNLGHVRSHLGLAAYKCNLCSYSSADKSTLIRHLRTHNGERPFQCLICDFAFTTKANCERHVRYVMMICCACRFRLVSHQVFTIYIGDLPAMWEDTEVSNSALQIHVLYKKFFFLNCSTSMKCLFLVFLKSSHILRHSEHELWNLLCCFFVILSLFLYIMNFR